MGVFEQRTGADGDRRLDGIEEREEVGYQRVWQLCPHEMLQDFLVGGIAEGNAPQVVLVHELVEEVGTQHDGLGYLHGSVVELVEFGMALDDVVEECQTTALTAQRTVADAGKVCIAVELQAVEDGYDTDILHPTVLDNGIENDLTMCIDILQFMPSHRLQELRHGEDGTGTEPATHVIARNMIEHRVVGNLEDIVLQFLQRRHAAHLFLGLGVTEHEVAEAHVHLYQLTQVDIHLLRVLVHETEAFCLCFLLVDNLRALKDEGNILVAPANLAQQLQTSLCITLLHMTQTTFVGLHRETGVRDDAQHVVVVLLIPLHGFFVVGGQHHLGTASFALGCSMRVQGLGREVLRLGQNIVVQIGQH